MRKREFHIGPGAASLILVAVVTAMSILGLLSLMNSRTDLQMARRGASVAEDVAALEAASEASFARLDAIVAACVAENLENEESYLARIERLLPENMELSGRAVLWQETGEDARALECGVEIAPMGETPRIYWTIHRHYAGIGGELEL